MKRSLISIVSVTIFVMAGCFSYVQPAATQAATQIRPQDRASTRRPRGMAREEQLKIISAIEQELAQIKAGLESSSGMREGWRSMSEQERNVLREKYLKQREEQRESLSRIEDQIAKLKGQKSSRVKNDELLGKLKAVRELALKEKAAETAAGLEKLIAEQQKEFASQSQKLDLSRAVIVHSSDQGRHSKAAQMLQFEIERRTGIKLNISTSMPSDGLPAILVGSADSFPDSYRMPSGLSVPAKAEGYAMWIDRTQPTAPKVYVVGRDDKGVVFGVGRLIRLLYLTANHIHLANDVQISTAPADPTRAHQIIRSTQCEDGFVNWRDAAEEQQNARDLILFGTNGFEARSPEDIDEYLEELDIDLYFIVTCQDIIDSNKLSDDEIRKLYTDIVGIDHITTYGGDASGSRPPAGVFPQMERFIPLVQESHPGVKWWYSNQCLDDHAVDYDDYIFNYINTKQPEWLYGMVYGPWTKRGIGEIRADLPSQYKIRHYPEICHVRWCQYPVPKWDRVWAQIWPRNQSIYTMFRMMAQVHRATRKDTIGFLPYNHTGSYNDLNKFIWSTMGWGDCSVEDFLYDYGKTFFAYDFKGYGGGTDKDAIIDAGARAVAWGLELLEDNWTGHLAENTSAESAEKLWKMIATNMGGVGDNWRLEMFLYKAMLDAQIKRKYDAEMECERQAYEALKQAGTIGVAKAVENARAALAGSDREFQSKADFERELKSWGLSDNFGDLDQVLDNMYSPLSDRKWIESQLDGVTTVADIEKILNYEDPGPGGFYDNLGVVGEDPHLVRNKTWQEDPGFVYSVIEWVDHSPGTERRHSQLTHATSRYDTPLRMRWEGLDGNASYHIKVVYLGPFGPKFTCKTDDGHEIHGVRESTDSTPVSYSIPQASTSDGVLELKWELTNIVRGVSVTEIWLIKD